MMYEFKPTHQFTSTHAIPRCSSSDAFSLPVAFACPSSLISVRATRATNSPVSVMIGNLPFLEVCKSLLACNKSIPSFAVTNSFTGVMMELSRVFLSLMKSLVGPCCTGVKVLMPYNQTSTSQLTCNRSTCKGRLASTLYQEAVSRLVTNPRSGRPICPFSVTGKPVKPNLLFNSSSSFRKHPRTSISAERGNPSNPTLWSNAIAWDWKTWDEPYGCHCNFTSNSWSEFRWRSNVTRLDGLADVKKIHVISLGNLHNPSSARKSI